VTRGFAGVPLATFLGLSKSFPGGSNSSWELTLPELIRGAAGGDNGTYGPYAEPGGLQMAVRKNLNENGARMLTTLIVLPMAMKLGSSLLKRPRRQANALLKQVGVTGVKV